MKKILIVSWSDIYGGAAQAANEIFKCLKKTQNIDFFVQNKITSNINIKSYKRKTINYYFRKLMSLLFYKLRFSKNDYSYNLINSDIIKISNLNTYDIVNLHWINSETLSIFDISKIKKKIVITLHDMWFMNGSEHYLYDLPYQYFKGGKKIKLNKIDLIIWKFKKKILKNKKIHIVAPSNWIANLAKKSRIFKGFPINVIPYPVDRKVFFKKKNKLLKVNNINISKEKNIIDLLFISAGGLFNYRKGFDILDRTISELDYKKKIRLIIVGSYKERHLRKINSNFIILGNINDKKLLNKIYNFSDILALPSRLDNLPNVGLEAQSCGLPIVSFNVGGIADIVDHKKNGYLAKPFSTKDYFNGINYLIKHLQKTSSNSLIKSKIWSYTNICQKYKKLFNEL